MTDGTSNCTFPGTAFCTIEKLCFAFLEVFVLNVISLDCVLTKKEKKMSILIVKLLKNV